MAKAEIYTLLVPRPKGRGKILIMLFGVNHHGCFIKLAICWDNHSNHSIHDK